MAKSSNTNSNKLGYEVGMKQARQISTMLRGVPDFSNAAQFNQYETGYQFVIVCKVPVFIARLAEKDATTSDGTPVKTLLNNFVITVEQESRGMSGFEDMSAETMEITDGISTLNMINKVTQQSASTFSMSFFEKSGTPIIKFLDYYLRGLKDPRTQAKTYNGALDKGWILTPGFEKEVFTLMYINTDNTMRKIEKAYLIVNGQPNKSEKSAYEAQKGDIANKEITVEFNGFPIEGKQVDKLAMDMLEYLYTRTDEQKVLLQSNDYDYFMVNQETRGFGIEGVNMQASVPTTNTDDLGTTLSNTTKA
ncbi:MAG: hypothetical protein ACLR5O_00515 [Romboutsia timonensis]|uniref:hypothetical protein n=1 Tax=Romboutsia timonensis TaxID=1776391 RepID=UPI0039A2C5B9